MYGVTEIQLIILICYLPKLFCNIFDTFGCSETQNFQINEPTPLNVISNVQHVTCNGSNNGQINLSVNGGISPYLFNWSNGDTSDNIINLSKQEHMVCLS